MTILFSTGEGKGGGETISPHISKSMKILEGVGGFCFRWVGFLFELGWVFWFLGFFFGGGKGRKGQLINLSFQSYSCGLNILNILARKMPLGRASPSGMKKMSEIRLHPCSAHSTGSKCEEKKVLVLKKVLLKT